MQWYYASNQQRQGPVNEDEFDRLVRGGVIQPSTLVWRQGFAQWKRYEEVAPSIVPPLPGENAAVSAPVDGIEDTAVCAISGKRYPKREMMEYQGRWVSLEHREEFFRASPAGAPAAGQFRYGGFWLRFIAKLADWIILWISTELIDLALGSGRLSSTAYGGAFDPSAMMAQVKNAIPYLFLNFVIVLAYECFFIRRFSATPGKLLLGLKLVRSDGRALSIGRIIGRHFAEMLSEMIFFLGYVIAAFDEEKRALHDYLCDTRVIKSRRE